MSEQDNLLKADGIEEIESKETKTTEDTTVSKDVDIPQIEVVEETQTEEETVAIKEEAKAEIEEAEKKIVNVKKEVKPQVEETQTEEEITPVKDEAKAEIEEVEEDTVEDEVKPQVSETEEVQTESDEVVNEIESSNAEDAEDEGNKDRHTIEQKEYEKLSLDSLVIELERLVKNEKSQAIKEHVENIRSEFKTKFNALLEEKKEEFLNEGGNIIDFYYSSPLQSKFKNAYKEYRNELNTHYKTIETNLKGNLAERLDIIENIKGLFNVEENINTTYKHFKELQERWKIAGPIPRDKYNNAWNSYHHHVEVFYDFLHLNRDLRDLDFKHNLDKKLKIIEQAEELIKEDNVGRSFRELQALHKMWKEELGPVAREHREEIWERFKTATKTIHDKRQAHYAVLEKDFEKNLEKKEEIIQAIQAIANDDGKSHSIWQKKIKEIDALRDSFFNAGKVPAKVNETTWAKFKDAVRTFNKKKNGFYKDLKKDQFGNLQKKMELIKIAEDNKDNDDFETVTPLMKKIQSEWKNIGHVPRKDSDKVWKQFKTACNQYFDKVHSKRNSLNKEGLEVYEKKNDLLHEIKALELSGSEKDGIKLVKDYIVKWKDLGMVPQNKRYIEGKFYKSIDYLFNKLNVNKNEIEMIKFENKLDVLNNNEDSRVLDNERLFIRKKIDEVNSEINQLENNLQFFKNVKDDNPVVKEVHANIKRHQDTLDLWKTKLKKIKKLY